jgi:AmmeMemoRadiSam system protein B
MSGAVRRSAVAGTWYPATPRGIVAEVEEYLAAAGRPQVGGRLVGLISPHAGLRYSGPVAAHGYALLRGRPSLTAVLVGPSHHVAFPGLSVFAAGVFETPLGQVPIADDLAAALLAAEPAIRDLPGPHRAEHSLEMQLPFLQHLVPNLRIVPILMGHQARAEVEVLSQALARVLAGRDVLLIASTDLSHYQPAPVAHRLDALVTGDVERFDADGLLDRIESSPGHACGGGPLVAVMKAARALGADHSAILRYGDSGDVGEGDKSRVVGYLSAALVAGGA